MTSKYSESLLNMAENKLKKYYPDLSFTSDEDRVALLSKVLSITEEALKKQHLPKAFIIQ